MALPKLYDRVYWDNNTTPAINEDNLNSLSKAVDDIDDRVISLAGTIMEDVPQIQEDLEILEPAIENIDSNVERAETAADDAEDSAETAEYWANVSNPPIPVVKDFASVISVDDAIPKAATDVKVKIEAVQDLHGYTKPWVGGAGKNKLPTTINEIKAANTSGTWSGNVYTHVNGIKVTILTDSDNNVIGFNINGTTNGAFEFRFTAQNLTLPAGSYIWSIQNNINIDNVWVSIYNPNAVGIITKTATSANYTCNGSFGGAYIYSNSGNTFNNVVVKPMLRLASVSDASYEPYSNICPISGFTEAKVTRTGKNLLPMTVAGIKAVNTGGTWSGNTYTFRGVTFTVSTDSNGNVTGITANGTASGGNGNFNLLPSNLTAENAFILTGCPSNGNLSTYFIRVEDITGGTTTYYTEVGDGLSINSGRIIKNIWCAVANGTTANNLVFKPMIRLATETDAKFAPYTGTDYIIDLEGTRYGATLDVTSGVMSVTHGFGTVNDISKLGTPQTSASGNWATYSVSGTKRDDANVVVISDRAKAIAYDNRVDSGNIASDRVYSDASENTIVLRLSNSNTITAKQDFYNYWEGAELCYELATPITVQLTPTEVEMLQGYNVLSANSGDVYLKYDASMIQRIANEKLDISTFKSVVASSSDFADFKTKVAAL